MSHYIYTVSYTHLDVYKRQVLAQSTKTLCEASMKCAVEQAVSQNENERDLCVALDGT